MTPVQRVLATARSENGYLEKATNAQPTKKRRDMYEATVCILQAVAFFAISLYKRLADFLLAGEASGFGRDIPLSPSA